MDVIRESLLYKSNKLHVCLHKFSVLERYELIRMIFAMQKDNVTVCDKDCNDHIKKILQTLQIQLQEHLGVDNPAGAE